MAAGRVAHVTPRVSVVVPVYNDADRLLLCLDAIERQTYPIDRVQVIVADNGSTDGTPDRVGARAGVRVVIAPEGGSYAARNAGVTEARGDIIAFTDADCVPDRAWLAEGVAAIEQLGGDGMVAGAIEVVPRDPRVGLWDAYDMLYAFPQERFVAQGFAATANVFIPRRAWERIGPFDPTSWSHGDVEWTRRFAHRGLPQVFAARSVVRHPARGWSEQRRKLARQTYGRKEVGTSPSWRQLLTGSRVILLDPLRAVGTRGFPVGVRLKAAVACVVLRVLGRWMLTLSKVLGRPTLRRASPKGW